MKLFFIHLKVVIFNLWEEIKVLSCYGKEGFFFIQNFCFHWLYLFKNPYKICRKHGFLYGETPMTTMDLIARECRILSRDTVYDLGCGRGRNLFWLAHFVKCRIYGFDLCDEFIQKGNQLKKLIKADLVSFVQADLLKINYEEATVIYLYGTSFSEEQILLLIERFRKLSPATKIITVSFALNEYCENFFELKKEFNANFAWGKTRIYLQTPVVDCLFKKSM